MAAVVLSTIYFIATQDDFSSRDLFVAGLAFVFGAALAATVVFLVLARQAAGIPDPLRLKKAELLGTIQTRSERLLGIRRELTQLRIAAENSRGERESAEANAHEAGWHSWTALKSELDARARAFQISEDAQKEEAGRLEAELARLDAMSDEEYLTEQVRLRGLG